MLAALSGKMPFWRLSNYWGWGQNMEAEEPDLKTIPHRCWEDSLSSLAGTVSSELRHCWTKLWLPPGTSSVAVNKGWSLLQFCSSQSLGWTVWLVEPRPHTLDREEDIISLTHLCPGSWVVGSEWAPTLALVKRSGVMSPSKTEQS